MNILSGLVIVNGCFTSLKCKLLLKWLGYLMNLALDKMFINKHTWSAIIIDKKKIE